MKISLLHATWRRPGGPLGVRDAWRVSADEPERVEHVFAMDDDDQVAIRDTEGCVRAISAAANGVSAVRNWNAAAALATGDVLLVIADDLFPPQSWDTTLTRIIGPFDPMTAAFAVKVTDSPDPASMLLRHPVVSRAFYERHGLFTPAFTGVYCDDDITRRAFWRSFILDGRALVLQHRHPTLEPDEVGPTESHTRINADTEYQHGRALFESLWPTWQRHAAVRLVTTQRPTRLPPRYLRWALLARSISEYALSRLAAALRLVLSPRRLARRLRRTRGTSSVPVEQGSGRAGSEPPWSAPPERLGRIS